MVLVVKNLLPIEETRDEDSILGSGRSPGGGHGTPPNPPLSILAWRIPWTEEPGGYSS